MSSVSIKAKLLALVGSFLVVTGMLAGSAIQSQRAQAKEAEALHHGMQTVDHLSDYVHALQIERGTSVGFLTGSVPLATLQSRRVQSDQIQQDPAVLRIRRQIDDRLIAAPQGFKLYSERISVLMGEIRKVSREAQHPRTRNLFVSHLALIQAKEWLGQTRATLNGVFSQDRFTPETYRTFSYVEGNYRDKVEEFLEQASPELKEAYRQNVENSALTQTDAMIKTAFQGSEKGRFGIAPKTWFKTVTQVIDNLKTVEDRSMEGMVSTAADVAREANQRAIAYTLFVGVIFAGVIGVSLLLIQSITRPINRTTEILKDIAQGEGDLTRRIEVKNQDEIGQMANWFNLFMDNLQQMVRGIQADAKALSGSAGELSTVSNQMSGGASLLAERSSSVAAAAEEMSMSMVSVSASSEQSHQSTGAVAAATEEMTATVGEIAQNADKARIITKDAVNSADKASIKVNQLGLAAREIGDVVELILEIAEQTKLLALNATIEAARAGEAGKGFTVVANEVKALANQTNSASANIQEKIVAIQSSTQQTVDEINQINRVIHDVDDIITSIATAVEEQTATTREIAGNVQQAAEGIRDMSQNVTQASDAAQEVAQSIVSVHQTSGEINQASQLLDQQAGQLAAMGQTLLSMVNRFKA